MAQALVRLPESDSVQPSEPAGLQPLVSWLAAIGQLACGALSAVSGAIRTKMA